MKDKIKTRIKEQKAYCESLGVKIADCQRGKQIGQLYLYDSKRGCVLNEIKFLESLLNEE